MNKSSPSARYPKILEVSYRNSSPLHATSILNVCFLIQDKRDHLIRTEGSYRQDEEMDYTVIDIEKLSNSVRGIKLLASNDKRTSFKVDSISN